MGNIQANPQTQWVPGCQGLGQEWGYFGGDGMFWNQ